MCRLFIAPSLKTILFISLLVTAMTGCSSMFKDKTKRATIIENQSKMVVAKKLYLQAKKCWATEYERINSGKELLAEIAFAVLGEDGVKTRTRIKSINELDGIHIIVFYQHDGVNALAKDKQLEYQDSGPDHPHVELLITEISNNKTRISITDHFGYENPPINDVKNWLMGNTQCQ